MPFSEREGEGLPALSKREHEVLRLMAGGWSNEYICRTLELSPRTVESHVRHIFLKLGLPEDADQNRRVLAAIAYLAAVGGGHRRASGER